jgi:hypothetical protein
MKESMLPVLLFCCVIRPFASKACYVSCFGQNLLQTIYVGQSAGLGLYAYSQSWGFPAPADSLPHIVIVCAAILCLIRWQQQYRRGGSNAFDKAGKRSYVAIMRAPSGCS